MNSNFSAEFVEDGILRVAFNLPDARVNLFTRQTAEELQHLIADLQANSAIRGAIVTSGKPEHFLAGVDIHEIQKIVSPEDAYQKSRQGQELLEAWHQLPFPTVAVIHGSCMGGGTEWVLAFDYRLTSDYPRTRIGLPEVRLGLMPGWGGTVRLPHLIGVQAALEMILSGAPVDARRAVQIGLSDGLVPWEIRETAALAFLKKVLADDERNTHGGRQKSAVLQGWQERKSFGRKQMYRRARIDLLARTRGLYPAPLEALRSVMFARENDFDDAMKYEARKFAVLAAGAPSRHMVRVFLMRDQIKNRPPMVITPEMTPIDGKIAVIGGLESGGEIARLAAAYGHPVRFVAHDAEAMLRALRHAESQWTGAVEKGIISAAAARRQKDLVSPTLEMTGLKRVNLFIENCREDKMIHKETLRQLSELTVDPVVTCTTSALFPISSLAKACHSPAHFAGLQFHFPLYRSPLVEIIPGEQTAGETLALLHDLMVRWKKVPVLVKDVPGFLIHRLRMVYLAEAFVMLAGGIALDRIDAAMEQFGMAEGPFRLADRLGYEDCVRLTLVVQRHLQERFPVSEVLRQMLEHERLGSLNQRGFYRFDGAQRNDRKVDRSVYGELRIKPVRDVNLQQIQDRIVYLLVNEAAFLLAEGVVDQPQTLDIASVLGLGFPPFHGGLISYADAQGPRKITARLNFYADAFGNRYTPAPLLERLQDEVKEFYPYFRDQGADADQPAVASSGAISSE